MTQCSWFRSVLTLLLVAGPVAVCGAQEATADDIAQGKAIFGGACVVCHGIDGGGAMAPPLNRPTLQSAPDDTALQRIIREGMAERGMPRVRRFTDNELRQLTAYVRSLARTTRGVFTGNAAAGAAVYDKSGCATCHIVRGQGGSLGPQLTNVGFARGAAYLRQAIVEPGAALPRNAVMGLRGYDEYLPVQVVTSDGRRVRGVRVNEDAFTIQMRDVSGALHSFRKSDVRSISKEPGASLMPSYRARLSETELDDLVAYLASLGGTQ
jgi:putative heme-binding domain-containing protein